MRILLLVHGFNALSQRLFCDLRAAGHEVSVEFDINDRSNCEATDLFAPDLVLAPYMKRAIPETIWERYLTLVIHPGPPGDRGPSALDWAILEGARQWGVTLLQATADLDGGPIWAYRTFPMRAAPKSSLYRQEVTEAAVACVFEGLDRIEQGHRDAPIRQAVPSVTRPSMPQSARTIDWATDTTADVIRKLNASDGMPGVRAEIEGRTLSLHDGRPAPRLRGVPGTIVATSGPAVGIATVDGGVWIGRMRDRASTTPFKLPATRVLSTTSIPESPVDRDGGYREIAYREDGRVGLLSFSFLNGAMGTEACERLLSVYRQALARPTDVLILEGGPDFWSNGMDLNLIEAADSPADESWANINAIDDLAEAILRTSDKITVAAVAGNVGAGGVFLARACDDVWLRDGVILNPHYKDMGNLHGSEFWTYTLPRHTSQEQAGAITAARLPMAAREALSIGLADRVLKGTPSEFFTATENRAQAIGERELTERLATKAAALKESEATHSLADCRAAELARMKVNFYGFDPSYHIARSNFVRKIPKARTPLTLALHRANAVGQHRKAS